MFRVVEGANEKDSFALDSAFSLQWSNIALLLHAGPGREVFDFKEPTISPILLEGLP